MIKKSHANELCQLVRFCRGRQSCHNNEISMCVQWSRIDPFKRKLLEIKYKEKNERNSIK